MLKPGLIPEEEPLLRVGIVLPEDMQASITMMVEDIDSTSLVINDNHKAPVKIKNQEIKVAIEDDTLRIKSYDHPEAIRNIKLIQKTENSSIDTYPVIAGRGFHWAKHIHVNLPFTIELKIAENSLLLVNELPMEMYLACVATSEMSGACPGSFMRAQTIVARSWMLANVEQKHLHLGIDVCNDDCCQRYQGTNNLTEVSITGAVETRGQVLLFDGDICDARYSKSCGGVMEKFENLWEGDALPYMQNIPDAKENFKVDLCNESEMRNWVETIPETFCSPHFIPENELKKYLGSVDEEGHYFRWTVETSQEEIVNNLNDKLNLDIKIVISIIPLKRAGSGRILELEISYLDNKFNQSSVIIYKDYNIRQALHKKFLYSSAIIIEDIFSVGSKYPKGFLFKGAGWGHGAGLCQIGGLGMSLKGYNTEDILSHYYPGSGLKKIYS
jgi:peptidoglycan hydrolase-like amidase